MKRYISSTFSVNMLAREHFVLRVAPLTPAQARKYLQSGGYENVCNPRHESTCALVAQFTTAPPKGGMLNITDNAEVLVILPPRELTNRAGSEITVSDWDTCQFFNVDVHKCHIKLK